MRTQITLGKVLTTFSASLLLFTASASAEVSLSGEGKLGLSYQNDAVQEWGTISSANVKFTLSGTSDNDMISEFGANFTLDADEETSDGTLDNPFVVYVGSAAGPFGKIEAGTDLGLGDKRNGGLGDAGLNGLGLDDLSEAYYGGSGKKLRYSKNIAGAGVSLSTDMEDDWAIGGEYAFNDQITLEAGYDQRKTTSDFHSGVNSLNTLSVGVFGNVDQFHGGFLYNYRSTKVPAEETSILDKSAYGLEVGYTLGTTTFTAHYGKNDGVEELVSETSGWGVGMSHDLGGGLSFKGGYANIDDVSKANFGFLMAF